MNKRTLKFLSYYRPYLGLLGMDLFCAFLISAVTLILPLCVRYITDVLLPGGSAQPEVDLALIAALMLALVAAHALCNLYVDYQGHVMGALMERDMRRELFAHYQKLSFRFHDEQKTGQLMSRITNDLFALSELYHHGPEDIAIGILKFGGVLLITFGINPLLSLLIFLFLPPMVIFALHFNRKMYRAMSRSKQRIAEVNAQVEDSLSGIRVVQSFANEDLEQAKFDRSNRQFVESRRHEYINQAYFYGGMSAFTQLMTVVVVVFGAVAILQARLQLSDLITFLLYVGILIEPIQRLVNFSRWFQEGFTGFARFMNLLALQPEIQDNADALELRQVTGALELQDVSFGYDSRFGDVLKGLSLRVGIGEYLALVGVSGVGKTTLSALIPRFYEVSAGRICLDGVDIRGLKLSSLRRHIGIVQQDVYLFGTTVADNIRYGKIDASPAEIEDAARSANAHDFIMALPDGYETDVGQRGIKLSTGQRQRISIARLFLKDPPLIILDEATSALDNESERAVQESLTRLTRDRTTLVIAHRLSTIRNADRIVVLQGGGIVEGGTHDELIAHKGIYADLYQLQMEH